MPAPELPRQPRSQPLRAPPPSAPAGPETVVWHVAPKKPADLVESVYTELRNLAGAYIRREAPGATLQATMLVHEAYLKLADQTRAHWKSKTHFKAVAAQAMRRILVDHARSRKRLKRGGGAKRLGDAAIDIDAQIASEMGTDDAGAIDEALQHLAQIEPRQAQVVEMRFFGGLSEEETAEALGVSRRTVQEDWRKAREWLSRELSGRDDGNSPTDSHPQR